MRHCHFNVVVTGLLVLLLSINIVTSSSSATSNKDIPPQACDASSSSSSSSTSCDSSSIINLKDRIAQAINPLDGTLTAQGTTLRGIIENVLSPSECQFLQNFIPSEDFIPGAGYDKEGSTKSIQNNNNINVPKAVSGVGLQELVERRIVQSQQDYDEFLRLREHVRLETERALQLSPGTLCIHYTHVTQKTVGGTHRAHADNCFHTFENDNHNKQQIQIATCDAHRQHPYPMRIAASILFINDKASGNFQKGEFYWANVTNGEPQQKVEPQAGRMTYFTSGPENLHGALPVEAPPSSHDDDTNSVQSRRLTLAMWYTVTERDEEIVPQWKSSNGDDNNSNNDQDDHDNDDIGGKRLFTIPVESLKKGGLRFALGMYLVGQQNTPSKGSWRVNQGDDGMISMIFKDHTAMVSIKLYDTFIAVARHVDHHAVPSLQYMLQESLLLHGILDELHNFAFENSSDDEIIKDQDRLLKLQTKNVIEEVRLTLPARSVK